MNELVQLEMGKAALGVLIGLSLIIEGTCLSEAEGDLVFTSIVSANAHSVARETLGLDLSE